MKKRQGLISYNTHIRRKWLTLLVVVIATLVLGLLSIARGPINLSLFEILNTFLGKGEASSQIVILEIRTPRVVAAILVGAALGVTGAVMQCVLNNPLASASTLGVSQGASFGAAVGIIVFGGGVVSGGSANVAVSVENPYIVTLCAFIFGSMSTVVILLMSQLKRNLGPGALILVGVALGSLFTGGSTLLQYFADETKLSAVVFWTFGNLGGVSWKQISVLAVILLITMIYFIMNRWNYNAMQNGSDVAKSLGVNARNVMLVSMGICSLAAAVSVAFAGIISFVGLVAPHMMRKFVGDDYRFLIPCSAVMGSLVLLAADTFGRLIIQPVILPVGAITAFLGAPVFLVLLLKGDDRR